MKGWYTYLIMKKLIFLALLLSILFACLCVESIQQKLNEPIIVPANIEDDEYQVYSTVLLNGTQKDKTFLIHEQTAGRHKINDELIDTSFEAFKIKIDYATVKDYNARNQGSSILENKFTASLKVIILSEQEISVIFSDTKTAWQDLHKKYPNAKGIIEFSQVGFNKDKTQAILCFGVQSGFLSGYGEFIVLYKENGKWVIKGTVPAWIS